MDALEAGTALYNAGRFKDALAAFNAAGSPEASEFAAHCLEALGDRAGAARRLRALLSKRPRRASACLSLAGLLRRTGRCDEAERLAREALKLDAASATARRLLDELLDERAEALRARAETLEGRGDAGRALETLAELRRLRPRDVMALEAAARLELRLGRVSIAARLAEELRRALGGEAAGLRVRAACAVLAGRVREALTDLDAALRKAPQDAEARLWRAEALRLAGRPREAFAELDAARLSWGPTLAGELNMALARLDAGIPLVPAEHAVLLDLLPAPAAARLARARPGAARRLLSAALAELRGNRRPDATRAARRGGRWRLETVAGAAARRRPARERALSRPKPADVYLIGLGIPELRAMALAAREAAARCRVLFVNQPDSAALRELGPELRPIGDLRADTEEAAFAALAERVLAERRPGKPVGLAIYGHPLVYEPCCLRILDEARRRKLRVEVVAGVSSVDAILAALRLPLPQGVGLRAAEPSYALSPAFAPEPGAHTLIFKACQDAAELRRLLDKLAPAYPSGHKAALVQCLDTDVEWIRWAPLSALAAGLTRPRLFATLVVPAVGVRPR